LNGFEQISKMPRYLVTTQRSQRGSTASAYDAVKDESGVSVLAANDAQCVTIEAAEDVADRLRAKLHATHFVELEIRHSLH
jgi:hypothetical protein